MNKQMKNLIRGLCGVLLLALATSALAQQKQVLPSGDVVFQRTPVAQGPDGPMPPSGDTFFFVSSEFSFDGKTVKGAPYSAQAVTESTQTLIDGNRIVHKSAAAVYRDSEGRTRREQTLNTIGPFASSGDAPQTVFINDPVSGVNYVIDVNSRSARKMAPMHFEYKVAAPAVGMGQSSSDSVSIFAGPTTAARVSIAPEPGAMGGEVAAATAGVAMERRGPNAKEAKRESLGKQNIEGVEAEGSRTTVTIAAGEIGNDRPIEIVSERWYSPELQTVIMTRHSDPRSGETVYRLTNINRSEPAKSLFEVPADYTLKESPTTPQPMRMRRPANEQ